MAIEYLAALVSFMTNPFISNECGMVDCAIVTCFPQGYAQNDQNNQLATEK